MRHLMFRSFLDLICNVFTGCRSRNHLGVGYLPWMEIWLPYLSITYANCMFSRYKLDQHLTGETCMCLLISVHGGVHVGYMHFICNT